MRKEASDYTASSHIRLKREEEGGGSRKRYLPNKWTGLD